jgi:Protein of unknown function (DUF3592)
MAFLVIDIVIAFLVRTAVNAWRKTLSIHWPIHSGTIASFHYEDPAWGCDYGEYRYQYFVDGTVYRGKYQKPYYIRRSLDARESDSIGATIEVRVSPHDPAQSVLIGF